MAHHYYGPTYKWMLLGDDDTLWFMLGVKRLLYGYDPNLAYAISDQLGDHNARGFFVPSPLAAVCSPCHWPDLLRSHHREDLLPYSSAALTEHEAATWESRELDGWGVGRLRMRKREGAGDGANSTAATGLRTSRTRRRRAASDGTTQQSQPLWGRKGQVPINMSAVLEVAYYSTAPGAGAVTGAASRPRAGDARPSAPAATFIPPPIPPPGCPCRPSGGCLHRARVCRGRGRGQELCGNALVFKMGFRGNRTWCRYSWAHGGAGVVLSVGLLKATAGGPAEACARATQVHSCDMNLAMCLMNLGLGGSGTPADPRVGRGNGTATAGGLTAGAGGGDGFMFTHPGNAALRGANWADPRFIVFDNPVYQRVLHDPVGFLEGRVTCGHLDREAATAVVTALAAREGPEDGGGEGEGDGEESAVEDGEDSGAEGADGGEAAMGSQRALMGVAGIENARDGVGSGGSGRLKIASMGGVGLMTHGPAASAQGWVQVAGESSSLTVPYRVRGLRAAQKRGSGGGGGGKPKRGGDRAAGGNSQGSGGQRQREGDLELEDDQAICGWLVRHAVSLHMHGRSYVSYDDAARAMESVVRQHLRAFRMLRQQQQQQQQQ